MAENARVRRAFRREAPDQRRVELIEATLRLVGRNGIEAASVRNIAAEAGVTPGLIRHHFAGKDDLLRAAFDHHMRGLVDLGGATEMGGRAVDALAAFIRLSLSPPVASPRSLQLWAAFLQMVPHDTAMREIHRRHYDAFRLRLEWMIAEVLREAGRAATPARAQRLATACNALIDGLWLEGSALPEILETEALVLLGLDAVSALLDLPLPSAEARS